MARYYTRIVSLGTAVTFESHLSVYLRKPIPSHPRHSTEYIKNSHHHVLPILHQPHQSLHVMRLNSAFLVEGPRHCIQGGTSASACAWVPAIVRSNPPSTCLLLTLR